MCGILDGGDCSVSIQLCAIIWLTNLVPLLIEVEIKNIENLGGTLGSCGWFRSALVLRYNNTAIEHDVFWLTSYFRFKAKNIP